MSNMGYCRWQNTLADLRDCYHSDREPDSREELQARIQLINLCQKFINEYDVEDLEQELKEFIEEENRNHEGDRP